MASHLLVLYDYTCYSKTGEVTDNGKLVSTIWYILTSIIDTYDTSFKE